MQLISLNIEGNRHLEQRVLPFLQREQPDLVCLQEVFECDIETIQRAFEMSGTKSYARFAPMSHVLNDNPHLPARGTLGILMLSRAPIEFAAQYYVGDGESLPVFFTQENPNALSRVLLIGTLTLAGNTTGTVGAADQTLRVATTHFTWSPQGIVTPEQRADFAKLSQILETQNVDVLCGDLNTPRGKELYSSLSEKFQDGVPPHITTTIDRVLHRSGQDIQLVVDGLFTSARCRAKNVQIVDGLSDHMGIMAQITMS